MKHPNKAELTGDRGARRGRISAVQQRFWFLDQLNLYASAHHAMRLVGPLDVQALNASLHEVIRRHDTLRSSFPIQDGRPTLEVHDSVQWTMTTVDLTEMAASERESAGRRLLTDEMARPFDLQHGSLLRAKLFRLGERDHLWLLSVHRLAADRFSVTILLREIALLYGAFSSGQPSPLVDEAVQYSDYAQALEEYLQGEALEELLEFWRAQLPQDPSPLHLPFERVPTEPSWDAARKSRRLPEGVAHRIEGLCRDEDCELSNSFLAAFMIILHRMSARDHITVGVPVANREEPGSEKVVGPLANILVVAADLAESKTFRAVLRRLVAAAEAARAHCKLPFERLVRELQPDVEPALHPLANIAFDPSVNPFTGGTRLHGLTVTEIDLRVEKTPFSLKLATRNEHGSRGVELAYQRARFTDEWIDVLLDQMVHLLAQAAEDPDGSVSDFSLVSPACGLVLPDPTVPLVERAQMPVCSRILDLARSAPDRPAIRRGDQQWSYGTLADAATSVAAILVADGLQPGQVVAVVGPMSFGMVAGMTGVMLAGGVLLTLDPFHPVARRRKVLSTAGAVRLIRVDDGGEWEPLGLESDLIEICPETGRSRGASGSFEDFVGIDCRLPELSPDQAAYMAFTSGSTGAPKGVLCLHKGLSHAVGWQVENFSIGPGDRCAQMAAPSFDTLFRETYLPLTAGASLHLRPRDFDYAAEIILPWLEKEGITVLNSVPSIPQMWIGSVPDGVTLSALRWLFLVGEPLSDSLVRRWRSLFPSSGSIVNFYGTTETSLVKFSYRVPETVTPGVQPAGWPLPETQGLVVSTTGQLCGRGEPGEVLVRTPHLSPGYVQDQELTAALFVANPFREDSTDLVYRTGDRGAYRLDGSLKVSGRVDRQVKIRGVRIDPGEIAAALAQHHDVDNCAVATRSLGSQHDALIAFVVPRAGSEISSRTLLGYLGTLLPRAMVPARVVFLERMPHTSGGKIDYLALAEVAIDTTAGAAATTSSETVLLVSRHEVVEVLSGLWAELTGRSRVGVDESFFEAGGDSLLATQLVSRLAAIFHLELPLRVFFESPTITRLADVILARLQDRDSSGSQSIEAVARDKDIPLSFAQQRLWFMYKLVPSSPAYNLPTAFCLEGDLELRLLEQALHEVIRRHESLRTTFPTVGDQPCQRIADDLEISLPLIDLLALPGEEREGEARRLAEQEAARLFELEAGPLLRAALLKTGEQRYLLLITLHHIVSDGWSQGIFFRELSHFYAALCADEAPSLSELPVQYADFSLWQRQWLTGATLKTQLDYWTSRLEGLTGLELPTDRPRPSALSFRGAAYEIFLPRELSTAVEELSLRSHSSVFMTLLAAFMVVLHRWTGQTEIVVGAPIANRNREELEGLIGFFVNNLVIRGDLTGDPTFVELLERVRELALGAYAHQDLPFDRLVEELAPIRDLSRHPLFQVVFALHNVPQFDLVLPGVEVRSGELDFEPVGLDLEFHFWKTGQGLRLRISYATDLFDAETIARLAQHLQMILEGVTRRPMSRLRELSLLSEEEKQRLISATWTEAPFPDATTIHRLFEEQAAIFPDAPAVRFGSQQVTYDELNSRANQLAHHLMELGVAPEARVAISVERSVDMVVGVLAILKAGGAYVPLDPSYPLKRLTFMLEDSGARLLLTQEKLRQSFPNSKIPVLCIDRRPEPWMCNPTDDPNSGVGARNLAYVIYTSGSTGMPKGVLLEHRGLCNMVSSQIDLFDLGAEDRILQFASLSFDGSVWEMCTALVSGATLVLGSQTDLLPGEPLCEFLARQEITTAVLTPTVLAALPATPLPQLRVLGVAGEPCPRQLVETWAEGRTFFNGYGPTETTVCATIGLCSRHDQVPVIGRPINNVRTLVLDADFEPVPVGVPGELHVGGVGLARGYLNQAELTAERFIADPFAPEKGSRLYRTGDLVRYRSDGSLEFLGRLDRQVKIRAFRVELDEIAAVMQEHPAVRSAVVEAREDGGKGLRLAAYVVAEMQGVMLRSRMRSLEEERVSQLQSLSESPLSPPAQGGRLCEGPHCVGGKPMPAEEKKEWLGCIVDRVFALRPRKVLEIGCGSGMLLLSVAPFCTRYVGTDLSETVLDTLLAEIGHREGDYHAVELIAATADDFSSIDAGSFDTVVLNSVVQYFPSHRYLIRVLEGAVEASTPFGMVFIGDVRSLQLNQALCAAVELEEAEPDLSAGELRERTIRRSMAEEELLLDPRFFLVLPEIIPRVRGVRILPKRGGHRNEVTSYRYDVILQLDQEPETLTEPELLDWEVDKLSLSAVRKILLQREPLSLGIANVPNARLCADIRLVELLRDVDDKMSVEVLRQQVDGAACEGVDPEEWYELGGRLPYELGLSWSDSGKDGRYDVILRHTRASQESILCFTIPWVRARATEQIASLANDPLRVKVAEQLEPELREYLREQLPEFMIPSRFVFLDKMPLTASGKIDRRALPAPIQPVFGRDYVAPGNSIEERLAEIWQEALGIDLVGVHDDFFDLGGESILSVQVVSQANREGLRLSARQIFENPTIAELAGLLVEQEQETRSGATPDSMTAMLEAQGSTDADSDVDERARPQGSSGDSATEVAAHLVPLHGDGKRRPLFCVHAFGGFVLAYAALAARLGQGRPVYGIQAWRSDAKEDLLDSITSMAGRYLEAVRTVQPQGPYLLCGWSMGGVIAFEMAQQLLLGGEEVGLLALIDSTAPRGMDSDQELERLQRMSDAVHGSDSAWEQWRELGLEDEVKALAAQEEGVEESGAVAAHSPDRVVLDRLAAHLRAITGYSPSAYPGSLMLFRAQQRKEGESCDSTLGWADLVGGRLEVCVVPGDHLGIMRRPRVQVLAERMAAALAAISGTSR